MCIKRIALSFVLFILIAFVSGVNMANAEETNTTDIEQSISEQNIPVQISFVDEGVPETDEPLITFSTDKSDVVEESSQEESDNEQIKGTVKVKGASEKAEEEEKTTKKKSEKKDSKKKYTKAELRLMAAIIYCEAGNESYAGKLAVGIVIMNRKTSRGFPNTVKGVIYQRGQFTPARNGILSRALSKYDSGKFSSSAEKQCIKAAKKALSGEKSITYKGESKDFSSFHFFSGYISNARFRLGSHMFK